MTRRAPFAVPTTFLVLLSCGGSVQSVRSALEPCAPDVCGASGAAVTLRLTSFDHASDVLDGHVGTTAVSLVVSPSTQPLPAEPCAEGSPLAELITQWNATAPVDPFGHFDLFDYDGDYHRLLAKLAAAGASAAISVAPDMTTVATVRPLCTPAS